MSIISIDRAIVTTLDSFLASNQLFRILVYNVGENPLVRSLPIFLPLLLFWFSDTSTERRSRILTGLLGVCTAVFISVSMQYLFQVHTRPVLDPSLHLNASTTNWDHESSFPSDTAMLFFALSTVLFLLNHRIGALSFIWSFLSAGICRVAIGWHYPSDILGSLLIAPVIVVLIARPPFFRKLVERGLIALEERTHIVNALLVVFLADAWHLFPGLRGIFQTLVRLVRRNFDIPD